jgi:gluconate 5-dehydrogenase
MIHGIEQTLGRLDVVVANAGVFEKRRPSETMSSAEWDHVLRVNLTGVMNTCLASGRAMISREAGGSIVVISSVYGMTAGPGTPAYVASKHGVIGLAKTLAIDWAKYQIRVNVITPGWIARDEEPLQRDPDYVAFVTRRTPLGRWGDGRELGLAVTFLASDAASYVTGATLAVDGGWLAT